MISQEKHGKPCPYCTRKMVVGHPKLHPTRDHIKPKSKGLSILPKNGRKYGRIIVVCSECNFMKGNLSLNEFILYLIRKNEELLRAVDNNIERMRNIEYLQRTGLES